MGYSVVNYHVLNAKHIREIRKIDKHRLRAVSYFSLQSYYTQNLSMHASGEAACREKRGRKLEKKK